MFVQGLAVKGMWPGCGIPVPKTHCKISEPGKLIQPGACTTGAQVQKERRSSRHSEPEGPHHSNP